MNQTQSMSGGACGIVGAPTVWNDQIVQSLQSAIDGTRELNLRIAELHDRIRGPQPMTNDGPERSKQPGFISTTNDRIEQIREITISSMNMLDSLLS
jgi:hypothetical protein